MWTTSQEHGTRAEIGIAFLDGPAADWAELYFGFSDVVALRWAEWSRRLTDRFGKHDPSQTGKQLLSICRKLRKLRAERAEKAACTRRTSTSASFLRRGDDATGTRRRVRWFDETAEDEDEDEAPEPELGRNRTTVSRPDGARRLEQASRHLPTDAPEFATADAEDEAFRQLPAGMTTLPVKKQEKNAKRDVWKTTCSKPEASQTWRSLWGSLLKRRRLPTVKTTTTTVHAATVASLR